MNMNTRAELTTIMQGDSKAIDGDNDVYSLTEFSITREVFPGVAEES